MITLTILLIAALIFGAVSILVIGAGGAAFVIVFGDAIIAVALIVWIIKHLVNKNKKD